MRYGEPKKDLGRRAIEGLRPYGLELTAEFGVGEEGLRGASAWWGAISCSRRDEVENRRRFHFRARRMASEVEFRLLFHFPDEVVRNSTTKSPAGPGTGSVV